MGHNHQGNLYICYCINQLNNKDMKDINKIATFNFNIKLKGFTISKCKSQQHFGHHSVTNSQNKIKETPIKYGFHTEDYNRMCVYAHYYNNEEKPFYIGQGTIGRAFYFRGPRRNESYNNKVKDINLVHVEILAIDITEKESIELEKKYIAKYKFKKDDGSLVNIEIGGRGGSRGKYSDNKLSKPIVQYDKYYNFIRQWASAAEAADTLGFDASSISKCCRHAPKYKSHKGYIWEFLDD